jgi:hypothetical protein
MWAIMQSRANMETVIQESGVSYTYEQPGDGVRQGGQFHRPVPGHRPLRQSGGGAHSGQHHRSILPDKISDIVANSSVKVVDYAVTPHTRVSPSYFKYAAIGLLGGIVLARGWCW